MVSQGVYSRKQVFTVRQEQTLNMTLQEKLDVIDDEIKKLYLLCLKAGYSHSEIEKFAQPFFQKEVHRIGSPVWTARKAWKAWILASVVIFFGVVVLTSYNPYNKAERLFFAVARQAAVKILPLWDWTQIRESECLVDNPFYETPELREEDCERCEAMDNLERLHDVKGEDFFRYVEGQIPFIVEATSGDRNVSSNITIHRLARMFTSDRTLSSSTTCDLRTNIRGVFEDHIILMKRAAEGKLHRFYAHWRNCDFPAAKIIRQLYSRPYFLPSVYSLTTRNWILLSSNYSGKIFKPLDVPSNAFILLQLEGANYVNIGASRPCFDICTKFEDTLHQGEILVIPADLWETSYLPTSSPENIAILLEINVF